ncbi:MULTISPECIES: hypothetical protein [unclassified Chamaesiphon]|jgi:hypothetical protein|uniref:hypothetical protein n=1 Tax=unclassified Chamaesiphon TaxID=2620921 RepID=UPI00286A099A|nr:MULTISPECIES: hypothetical protein [unclassified Chamaesiphon]
MKINFQEIYEIRRMMVDRILRGQVDSADYITYHLYSFRGLVYFRLDVYSAKYKDCSVSIHIGDDGQIEIRPASLSCKKFFHQSLTETLAIIEAEINAVKAELHNF